MITERKRYILGLVSLLGSACGSPANQASTVYLDQKRVPANLRDDYASFAVNCSKCHGLARAFNAGVTDTKHWDLYVARMVRTAGSSISHEEVPGILRFLYWYTKNHEQNSLLRGRDEEPAAAAPVDDSGATSPPSSDDPTLSKSRYNAGGGQ